MKKYYVRFNWETKKVDIYRKENESLIGSVKIINGGIGDQDLKEIAAALYIVGKKEISNLEYAIFCEYRFYREQGYIQ